MFYDQARIFVKGGDGGNGIVSFRREKYVPEGGPNGGDGGAGGNVIFIGDEGLRTLVDFRYQRHYKAERGEHGMGKNMHGRDGEDMTVRVPIGTVVKDAETGALLADITAEGQRYIAAKGGRGGRGNAKFVSSTNRVPMIAEKGEPGDEQWLELELKLLADVGLVGFPNVGKSTLIANVSAARPKIANYHFTTLEPNLGVVRIAEGQSFVMADIPGLIEGAHTGAGLGHDFLRHTERTRYLVHVLDISGSEGRDPLEDYDAINRELVLYKPELANKPMVVAANKMDLPGAEEQLARLREKLGEEAVIFPISAATRQGLDPLIYHVHKGLEELGPVVFETVTADAHMDVRFSGKAEERFKIHRDEEGVFVVTGKEVERHVAMTDMENEESVARLQRIFDVMGVDQALRDAGCQHGDPVRIRDLEFDFIEYAAQYADRGDDGE
ncbi:GTPase ObgE [Heliobacterium gestii]|uniref:GTPase Obg n=1 Tax=Heliomicrobium gestii TaxID=2699 RepID=A0A845LCU0_HELGE|nr:GTPase ObgE [Heliomicrobium gestii]MBM7866867.1 GTP-binding protein [Heliomicrobium gestii]MZP42295.1 GTPase ObgE [Heliomicrobium gestii]